MHREVTQVDLEDPCRPTATIMVHDVFMWPADHAGTLRWPLRPNFSRVVRADRLRPQMDHL